jgi:hypothetical protein
MGTNLKYPISKPRKPKKPNAKDIKEKMEVKIWCIGKWMKEKIFLCYEAETNESMDG